MAVETVAADIDSGGLARRSRQVRLAVLPDLRRAGGVKLARLMESLIAPVVLLSTSTVKAESTRCAAKMESVSGSLVVAETLVPPNWLPLPS